MKTNRADFTSFHPSEAILALLALILAGAYDGSAQPVITNAPGYVITWDGRNGDNPASSAVPKNIALAAQGAVAYASGQLGPQIGAAFHYVTNLNDGFYGNTKSWIGGTNDPAPWFAGIQLPAAVPLTDIAWGRDNTGVSQDRCLGTYTVQVSTNASFTTNASAWTTLGTITYTNSAAGFVPSLRHCYKLTRATGGQIIVTAVRLLVPDSGLVATGTDIDELELFGSSAVDLAYWRMGENDPGAVVGLAVSTTDLVQGQTMTFSGGPFYHADVSASAATQVGSVLSMQFFNGTYGTNELITTLTDNFGLELWVKPDAIDGVQCLAYNGTTGGEGAGGWGIYLIDGQYTGLFGGQTLIGGAPATPGIWMHLALVRGNGTATLYVNGTPSGTSAIPPALPQGRFAVAAQPQSLNTEFFAGALDEVRVFAFAPGAFSTGDLLLSVLPPTVVTAAATDIGFTNATLNGTVNPQNLTTATWFEWGPTTTYGNFTATNTLAATNQFFALSNSLTGLNGNVTYHFRLAASNALGVSFGSDQSFTTPSFNLVSIPGLIGVDGDVAWGDYDNDGLLDFLIVGRNGSQLMRNTGSSFTNVPIGLSRFFGGRAAWGDFDNDGNLDFLVSGSAAGGDQTQLWRNNGDGTFSNVTASLAPGLPGAYGGCVAWGDYDNDGQLDILVTGRNGGTSETILGTSSLWRNTGNGFANVPLPGVPPLFNSSVAWGDYDNDGRLDFLIAGQGQYQSGLYVLLCHNTGNGFELAPLPPLPGLYTPKVAWGDYDNDGRLDFIYLGGSPMAYLCRNTGNGFQIATTFEMYGNDGNPTTASWGDFDNDGRLDLLIVSVSWVEDPIFDYVPASKLWRNTTNGFVNVPIPGLASSYFGKTAWGDFNNDGRLDLFLVGPEDRIAPTAQLWHNNASITNAPPGAPTGLALTATTNAMMLSWNSASDDHTPAPGLTYNVRAGSTPGGIEIFAGHVNATNGFRRVPVLGNAMLRHTLPLTGLTNGQTVYWSVQAVDTAFAGGPFAAETSVVSFPQLTITPHNATSAIVSWTPPTFGWRLQETTNLSIDAWSDSASGELNPATVPATNAAQFYRLMR